MIDNQQLPYHIAIIMDGNGRWAKARGLSRMLGHRAGAEAVERTVEACCDLGIRALTLYAFSWENWHRPAEEVHELIRLLDIFISHKEPKLHDNQVRLRAIGRLDHLPEGVLKNVRRVMANTAKYDRLTLTLALSYGGRQEITDAARAIARRVAAGELTPEQVDEAEFARHLYAPELPDPDLLIRTSGDQRLSNFLLWQTSYTELYVTSRGWPEFGKEALVEAIEAYQQRERRFGKTAAQVS